MRKYRKYIRNDNRLKLLENRRIQKMELNIEFHSRKADAKELQKEQTRKSRWAKRVYPEFSQLFDLLTYLDAQQASKYVRESG